MSNLDLAGNAFQSESKEVVGLARPDEEVKNGIWPRSIPLWMAGFYVVFFIIRPWEQLFPWLGEIHFERIYALCMISSVFLFKTERFEMSLQTVTVFLFFVGIALSAVFAINTSLTWEPLYKYFTLIIFYFVLLLVIRTPYELIFMVAIYITAMAVYLAKSQWEFFVHGAHRHTMGVIRLIGIENTFGGPNTLAASIAISLPLALFFFSYRREVSKGWPTFWSKWFPRFLIFYFLLAFSSIILTNSRSGMVSLGLFFVLSSLHGRGIKKKIFYVMIVGIILGGIWQLMPEENKRRLQSLWDPTKAPESAKISAEGRWEGFKAGLEMFKRFPITGVGIENFISYRVRNLDGVPLRPHNLPGQSLGETGLIGAITFLLMLLAILANYRKIRVSSEGHSDETLRVLSGLSGALRNSLFLLMFESLSSQNLLRFNWLWLAAFGVLCLKFSRQYLAKPIES